MFFSALDTLIIVVSAIATPRDTSFSVLKVTFTAILAVEARVIARVTALDSGLTVAA
jgi:hypothetical protein